MKKILGLSAFLVLLFAGRPAPAQVTSGRPGTTSAGPSVTLIVPSYAGVDLEARAQALVRPATRGRGEPGNLVLAVAGNEGGGLYVSRVVVGRRTGTGDFSFASLRGSLSRRPALAEVSSSALAVEGSGWRTALQDVSSLFGPAVRQAANGALVEPEIVIYEVGSF